MPDISLTDFVDFVIKSGTPRITKVKEIKSREQYNPAWDYWKQLREGIHDFHQNGARNKHELDDILDRVQDQRKARRYSAHIKAYKQFLGQKRVRWFDPPRDNWTFEYLSVKVNPELGLRIDRTNFLVKLYFKDESPTKNRLAIVSKMMEIVLRRQAPKGTRMAVLDVANGKLHTPTVPIPLLSALLKGRLPGIPLKVSDPRCS